MTSRDFELRRSRRFVHYALVSIALLVGCVSKSELAVVAIDGDTDRPLAGARLYRADRTIEKVRREQEARAATRPAGAAADFDESLRLTEVPLSGLGKPVYFRCLPKDVLTLKSPARPDLRIRVDGPDVLVEVVEEQPSVLGKLLAPALDPFWFDGSKAKRTPLSRSRVVYIRL